MEISDYEKAPVEPHRRFCKFQIVGMPPRAKRYMLHPTNDYPARSRSAVQIPVYRSVLLGDRCYFLVSEQESNQRNRLGDVLTAKPFVTAQENQHLHPTLSRPPPDPLQAPVVGLLKSISFDNCVCTIYAARPIFCFSFTAIVSTSAGRGT